MTFIVNYVRRDHTHDICSWLLFLLVFIFNTVGCVMNAYNNITWESDRLEYEEGSTPYGNTMLSILGIPSKPSKKCESLHGCIGSANDANFEPIAVALDD